MLNVLREVAAAVRARMSRVVVMPAGDAQSLGRRGEAVAAKHLQVGGYRILGRNLTSRHGEIDLLAQDPDGRTVVVVEVKAGVGDRVRPEVHVNAAKRRKLISLAPFWARRLGLTDRPWRFDIIAVVLRPGEEPVVRHHRGAFDARGRVG